MSDEPAVGTVVFDADGAAWLRDPEGWRLRDWPFDLWASWDEIVAHCGELHVAPVQAPR